MTIATGIFLRLSRVRVDEIPIAALLVFSTILADFLLVLLVAAVLGSCR